MGCLVGRVGDFMIIFSCPACGSRAFKLSEDLSEAHCTTCATSLGSWQALRRDISKTLATLRQHPSRAQRGVSIADGVVRIAKGDE